VTDSNDDKHDKVSIWMPQSMIDGLDRLRGIIANSGDELSRSEIVRLLISEGARISMGDREKTMREDVYDPAETDERDAEALSRRGRTARNKGASFERKIRRRLNDTLKGFGAKRTLQSRGGKDGPDVWADPFWIETKHGRKPNPRQALGQARRDSDGSGMIPMAVIKDDRKPPFVVMDFDDWLDFVSEWWDSRH